MEEVLLIIDQGGQSSRLALYRQDGEQLAAWRYPVTTRQTRAADGNLYIEQDPAEILAGIREGLQAADQWLASHPHLELKRAGYAGQGSSCLCWDALGGQPLSPVFSWQDLRASGFVDQLPLADSVISRKTGLRKSAHYGASKFRWALDNLPEVSRAAAAGRLRMGPVVTYILQQLTGSKEAFIDPGHAQRTLLWNMESGHWDADLLQLFGLEQAFLPRLLPHDGDFGRCRVAGREVVFRAVMRDQGASLFARGAPDWQAAYINLGTGAFLQRLTPQPQFQEGLLASPLWLPVKGQKLYALEATVNGAAAALSWLSGQCDLTVTPEAIAAALSAAASDALLLNAEGGLSAPWWRSDLESQFIRAPAAGDKIQAWVESVLFQLMVNLQRMNDNKPLQRLYVSGGLSQSDPLCQRLANLAGLPVIRHENPDATLQGVAFTLAGQPANWHFSGDSRHFQPQPDAALEGRFQAWQQAVALWLAGGINNGTQV